MRASTRKKQLRERSRRLERADRKHDAEFGITEDLLRPSGGRRRRRISWTVDPDEFLALMALHRLRLNLSIIERDLVVANRIGGVSWDDIGWALEMSGNGIRHRWPTADEDAMRLIAEHALAVSDA